MNAKGLKWFEANKKLLLRHIALDPKSPESWGQMILAAYFKIIQFRSKI